MHIKKLLSGSLAGLMIASSFNVPIVQASEVDETTVIEAPAEEGSETAEDELITVDDESAKENNESVTVEDEPVQELLNEGSEPAQTAVDISSLVITLNGTPVVYDGTNKKTAFTIASATNGETQLEPGEIEKLKLEFYTDEGRTTTTDEVTNAGTYYVKVVPAEANNGYTGEKADLTVTVSPKEITVSDVSIAEAKLTYAEDGVTPNEVKPTVTVAGLEEADFEVTYSDNTAVGTATATITIKNSNYTVPEGGLSKEFTITEDSDVNNEITPVIVKAGFNKEGSITKTLKSGRKTSEKILAVTEVKAPSVAVITEGAAKIDDKLKLLLSDGNVLAADNYTVTYVNNEGEGEATATIAFKPETNYEGSKEIKFEVVATADEDAQNKYETLVVDKKATFEATGSFHYENIYGEPATLKSGDKITAGSGEVTTALTHEIPAATATFTDGSTTYPYTGKEIKPQVNVSINAFQEVTVGENKKLQFLPAVYGAIDANGATEVNGPIIVSYKNNNAPGTATATIRLQDSDGLYDGETSLSYTIEAEKETIEVPYSVDGICQAGETALEVSYGTKVRFATRTTGAKIYYTVSSSEASDPTAPTAASEQYNSAIVLTDEMANADTITIKAIAIKGENKSEVATFKYNMLNEATDWGDVSELEDQGQWANNAKNIPEALWIGKASITDDSDLTYNGKSHIFTGLRVYYHKTRLTPGTDYNVKYTNNTNAWLDGNVKIYPLSKQPTITVTGKGKFSGTFVEKYEIQPRTLRNNSPGTNVYITLSGAKGGYNEFLSTGKLIKPSIKVFTNDTKPVTLKNNTDYTISYVDVYGNSNPPLSSEAGDKLVIVTFKGNYTGSAEQQYKVVDSKTAIVNATSISMLTKAAWTGEDIDMKLVLSDKKTKATLIKGTDYDVEVHYIDNGTYGGISGESTEAIAKPVGRYIVDITGKGAYCGTINKTFTVTGKKLSIGKIADQKYTGSAITPALTVKVGGKELAQVYKAADEETSAINNYEVYYDTNTAVGTATAIVIGNNDLGYEGGYSQKFKIVGTALKANEITLTKTELPFVSMEQEVATAEFGLAVKSGDKSLTANTDYEAAWYDKYDKPNSAKNISLSRVAGAKTLVITGKGGYTGTIKKTVKITPIALTNERITKAVVADATCTKAGAQGVVSIEDTYNADSLAKNILRNGRDFTVKYSKNTNAGKAKAVITGKGNYTGTLTKEFTVTAGDLENATITVSDIAAGKFAAPKTTVTLGKALAAKKDYTLTYIYNAPAIITRNKETVAVYRNDEVKAGDVLVAGTELRALATAGSNGDYVGKSLPTEGIIRVVEKTKNISTNSFKFAVKDQTYVGKEVILTATDFTTAKVGTTNLTFGTDFEIVEGSYQNNAKVGTAKVTIRGIGEYGGTKTLSFKIKAKSMLYTVEFAAVEQTFGSGESAVKLNPTGTTKAITSKDGTFKLPAPKFKVDTKVYVFEGWYADSAFNTRVGEKDTVYQATSIKAGESVTLYAKYEKVGASTVTFKAVLPAGALADAKITGSMKDQTIKRGNLTALSANAYKLAGYKFTGWKLVTGGEGTTESPYTFSTTTYADKQKLYNVFAADEKVILVADFEPIDYIITYKDAGNFGSAIYQTNTGLDLSVPSKDGYEFTGWKCSNSKALDVKTEGSSTTYSIKKGVIGNLTLTAQWKPNEFTIQFDDNKAAYTTGEGENAKCVLGEVSGTMAKKENVKSGTKLPANVFKVTGPWAFAGWSVTAGKHDTASVKYADKSVIKEAKGATVTYYAVWVPKTFTIKYTGTPITTAAPLSYNVENAAEKLAAAQTTQTTVTKEGKKLVWDVYANNKKLDAAGIEALKTEPKAITFKARWEDVTYPYTVEFNANAPTGKTATGATASLSNATAGTKLTKNGFAVEGYTFKGWATEATGNVAYNDEAELTYVANVEGKTYTLYAVWEEVISDPTTYTITYDYAGGSVSSANPASWTAGTADPVALVAPTKDGYDFAGWTIKVGEAEAVALTDSKLNDAQITGNATITATWTEWTRTVQFDKNDSTNAEITVPEAMTVKYTDTPSLDGKTPTGTPQDKTFVGWGTTTEATAAISDLSVLKPTAENKGTTITLYAIWGDSSVGGE